MAGFIDGTKERIGVVRGIDHTATGVTTSLVPILSVRNRLTFNGVANRTKVLANFIGAAAAFSTGKGTVALEIWLNAFLTAEQFAEVQAGVSPLEKDTSATAIDTTNAVLLGTLELADLVSTTIDVTALDYLILPGSIITVTGQTSSGTTDVSVSTTVKELL
jgi:hypothetical protein